MLRMDFGRSPASSNLFTTSLSAELFTSAIGTFPMAGFSHLSRLLCQPRAVAGLTGLRLRVCTSDSHTFACSLKVPPVAPSTTFLNRSTELAPDEFTISTFRRSRSDLVRSPRPDVGQIFMLIWFRLYCPGTSIRNLTRYQPPSLTMVPD